MLVLNQDSCNPELEELRSLVQFYLITAMMAAGREQGLRRRLTEDRRTDHFPFLLQTLHSNCRIVAGELLIEIQIDPLVFPTLKPTGDVIQLRQ